MSDESILVNERFCELCNKPLEFFEDIGWMCLDIECNAFVIELFPDDDEWDS